jgi:glycosyltransferase involved in cell wall biosynthesis
MIVPKISVIIPVYNVEMYLSRCLDSVINQTVKNIEIICVNDCSQNNCCGILKKYKERDSRISIINHEKNRGLSAARNTGMDASRGKYVYFIDSDDWIDSDYLEEMVKAAERTKLAIVMNTNILKEYGDGENRWYFQTIGKNKTGIIPVVEENLEAISPEFKVFIKKILMS